MTNVEALTLVALIAGPVIAVALQLKSEARKHVRDRQIQTMRMLVSSRHIPADPMYTQAINMIPIDFNRCEKVMEAWRDYQRAVNVEVREGQEEQIHAEALRRQVQLVFQILKYLGYKLNENEIKDSPYLAGSLTHMREIQVQGYLAWPRIATALERNNQMIAAALSANAGSEPDAQTH